MYVNHLYNKRHYGLGYHESSEAFVRAINGNSIHIFIYWAGDETEQLTKNAKRKEQQRRRMKIIFSLIAKGNHVLVDSTRCYDCHHV